MEFWFRTVDGGTTKEAEDVTRETAVERRQRRMKEKLEKAKLRKKALFDSEYDAVGGTAGDGKTFFDEWKSEMEVQAKVSMLMNIRWRRFFKLCAFLALILRYVNEYKNDLGDLLVTWTFSALTHSEAVVITVLAYLCS